jgi:hypothetical protein
MLKLQTANKIACPTKFMGIASNIFSTQLSTFSLSPMRAHAFSTPWPSSYQHTLEKQGHGSARLQNGRNERK